MSFLGLKERGMKKMVVGLPKVGAKAAPRQV